MNRSANSLLCILGFVLAIVEARADNLTLPTAGRVSLELITSDAAFRNTLSVVSPGVTIAASGCQLEPSTGLGGVEILSEKISQRGCRVELDSDPATAGIQPFAAGTVFEFNFCAQTDPDPPCEFVWSSDAADNSDMFNHVRIDDLFDAHPTLDDTVFRMSWEDLENGGDMDFNDLIAVFRINLDTDGDGLWDDWEIEGIDTNGNGVIDLTLPGADPMHKNLYLELDYMDCIVAGGDCDPGDTHSHIPNAAAVATVIQAFANAPVPNPDGANGIILNIVIDDALVHQSPLNINGLCFAGGPGIGSFDAVKAAQFQDARRFAYRYGMFTHQQLAGDTTSGCGELPGNDFQVSLGGWTGDIGSEQQQAGTLMHEFGHNLNLRHGGNENRNRKPNYLSVMSYSFQTVGIAPTDPDGAGPLVARVDYSPQVLPALNELNLSEPIGVQDGGDNTRFRCPGGPRTNGPASGPIDWNCDGDTTDVGLAVDLNEDGTFTNLTGFNDWLNIRYTFQSDGDFNDGSHDSSEKTVEMTFEIANLPPVADAGPDQTVECEGDESTMVILDGTGSSDPNLDELTLQWEGPFGVTTGSTPTVSLPTGVHEIILTVDDGRGEMGSDTVIITVEDTIPPELTLVGDNPMILQCGVDEFNDPGAAVFDQCDPNVQIVTGGDTVNTSTAGDYVVTYTAGDSCQNSAQIDRVVSVIDTLPPVIQDISATPNVLWPPNGRMWTINVSVNVMDSCDPSVECSIVDVSGGDSPDDVENSGGLVLRLRAERRGSGNGRTYTLRVQCTDDEELTDTATVDVRVPHDQRHGRDLR